MLTIHVWPKWLKRFLLTHPLYKSPTGKTKGAKWYLIDSELTVN